MFIAPPSPKLTKLDQERNVSSHSAPDGASQNLKGAGCYKHLAPDGAEAASLVHARRAMIVPIGSERFSHAS